MCNEDVVVRIFDAPFFAFQKKIHRDAEAVKLEARSLALVQTEDKVLCSVFLDMKQKAKELSNLNPCQHIQIQCFSTEDCSCDAST